MDPSEPIIRTLYPILDTAKGAVTKNETDSKVVGIIAASFFWKSFLENILPACDRSIIVVFENECNQTFTYVVHGNHAEYMGQGDHHELKMHKHGLKYTFEEDLSVNNNNKHAGHDHGAHGHYHVHEEQTDVQTETYMDNREYHDQRNWEIHGRTNQIGRYGGLPICQNYCSYTITTYPSVQLSEEHFTNTPVIIMSLSVCIFVFTALIFIGYDKLVQMRQRKVMKTAIQSTTIVSSLFPSNVRDRLMEEGTGVMNKIDTPYTVGGGSSSGSSLLLHQPTKTRLKTYLHTRGDAADRENSKRNKPIADLFADTTVLFADIAGFTAWSSVREPTQVFTLLETVYGAFDTIASRRGVFKVEVGSSLVWFCLVSFCIDFFVNFSTYQLTY